MFSKTVPLSEINKLPERGRRLIAKTLWNLPNDFSAYKVTYNAASESVLYYSNDGSGSKIRFYEVHAEERIYE